jgi:hypothetical protein
MASVLELGGEFSRAQQVRIVPIRSRLHVSRLLLRSARRLLLHSALLPIVLPVRLSWTGGGARRCVAQGLGHSGHRAHCLLCRVDPEDNARLPRRRVAVCSSHSPRQRHCLPYLWRERPVYLMMTVTESSHCHCLTVRWFSLFWPAAAGGIPVPYTVHDCDLHGSRHWAGSHVPRRCGPADCHGAHWHPLAFARVQVQVPFAAALCPQASPPKRAQATRLQSTAFLREQGVLDSEEDVVAEF